MLPKLKVIALTPLIVVLFFSLCIRFPSVHRFDAAKSGLQASSDSSKTSEHFDANNNISNSVNEILINFGSHSRKKLESEHENSRNATPKDQFASQNIKSRKDALSTSEEEKMIQQKKESFKKLATDSQSETSKLWGEGDDENSECLSRNEQHQFWKDPGPPKSEALIQAMKEYEEFHRDCRMKESEIGNMNTAFLNETILPCRYLVWLAPYDGMGNRFLSLISTYLYALLTKRVLVMDRRWKMEALLCDPFTESSIFLPKYVRTTKMISRALNIINMSDISAGMRAEGKRYTPSYSTLAYVNHESDMRFFCETDLMTFDQSHVTLLLSNMYYAPGFYFTSYRAEVERLFPDRRIFVHLARYLLNPTNKIWNSVKEYYYSESLHNAHRQIGMQVRLFDGSWQMEKSEFLLTCAVENNLLPEVIEGEGEGGGEKEGDSEGEKEVKNPTTVCLIASLAPQFYEQLSIIYENKTTLKGNVRVIVKRAGQENQQRSEVMEHNEQVIKEIWLLSFSHAIIASPASTFGYIASGLAGKTPLLLQGLASGRIPQGKNACWLYESPEPCYHAPPLDVRCPSDGIEKYNPWNRLPFLKHCHDFPRGVQVRMEENQVNKS